SPGDHEIFELNFNHTSPVVEIPIELDVNHANPIVSIELFANQQLIHRFTRSPFRIMWAVEESGAFLLEAKIEDAANNVIWVDPIQVQVVHYSKQVLLIEESSNRQTQSIKEALFDMGIQLRIMHPAQIHAEDLIGVELAIWKESITDSISYPELTSTLHHWNLSGNPVYLMTQEALIAEDRNNLPTNEWYALANLQQINFVEDTLITETIHNPSNEPFLMGQYGDIHTIPLRTNASVTAQTSHPDFIPILTHRLTGDAVMAAVPAMIEGSTVKGKKAIQLFPMIPADINGETSTLRSLFQNTVCWCMDCAPCENMDLSVGISTPNPSPNHDTHQKVYVELRHQGECNASGTVIEIQWSESLDLIQWSASAGWMEPILNGFRLHLGVVTSASKEIFEFTFQPDSETYSTIMAMVDTNNSEPYQRNNTAIKVIQNSPSIIDTPLAIIPLPDQQHALFAQNPFPNSGEWNIEWSTDLVNWMQISLDQGNVILPLKDVTPTAEETLFFRHAP
ncbi:hypothetical protein OAH23_09255, partial [Verrucomicrobia bacterium]|nr:hypothetical protein [Verrucomicrobiota bacterium]